MGGCCTSDANKKRKERFEEQDICTTISMPESTKNNLTIRILRAASKGGYGILAQSCYGGSELGPFSPDRAC